MLIYIGSTAGGEGISAFRTHADGSLSPVGVPTPLPSPTFLIEHPGLPVLYAVNTLPDGAVSAMGVDDAGVRSVFSRQSSGGSTPLHAAVTADGRHLICANAGEEGTLALLPLRADGSLEPPIHVVRPSHDKPAFTHHVSIEGDLVAVACLGLGELRGYRLARHGRLVPTWTARARHPKAGPRHVVRHPEGHWYVSDELDATVSTYEPVASPGEGVRFARSVPARAPGTAAPASSHLSEIAISADGRYVYAANRGPDTIAVFCVERGTLTCVGEAPTGGVFPRHLALSGSRIYVANERSDTSRCCRSIRPPACSALRGSSPWSRSRRACSCAGGTSRTGSRSASPQQLRLGKVRCRTAPTRVRSNHSRRVRVRI